MSSFKKNPKNNSKELIKTDLLRNYRIDQKFHLNDHHKAFVDKVLDDSTNIVFADGPAGSSKTYLSVFIALTLLKEKRIDEVLYVRSIVESANRKLGSLPGEVDDKFKPWCLPLVEKCDELVGKQVTNVLFENEYIRSIPVNFLRGATFTNCVVIADEAQNFDRSELITILTRVGKNCKLFFIGDSRQSDIHKKDFECMMTGFNTPESKDNGIECFQFTEEDITRSKLLRYIVGVLKTINFPKTSHQRDSTTQ